MRASVRVFAGALALLLAGSALAAGPSSPERIVSVGPVVTETILALGLGDSLVAVDDSSVPLLRGKALPKLGYQRVLATEGVVAQRPDLVLLAAEAGPEATLSQLRALGLRVVQLPEARDLEAAKGLIARIAQEVGREEQGKDLLVRMDEDVAAVRKAPSPQPSPRGRGSLRVLCLVARGGGVLLGAGRDTPPAELLRLVGAENALADVDGFKPVSPEALLAARPAVLVVPQSAKDQLRVDDKAGPLAGFASLPAEARPRVVTLPDAAFFGVGPSFPTFAKALAASLTDAEAEAK